MAKTRGTGLLMVWADIDPGLEAEYHRWYDEEHIAHLLAVPGFLSAGRYVALKGGPKYLALYELESPDVLKSPAFLDGVRFRPSARRVQYSGGPYMAVPGCLGARRYAAVDGQPKYLTLYEFENAGVSESAPWERARDSNPWSKRIRAFMRHDVGSPGSTAASIRNNSPTARSRLSHDGSAAFCRRAKITCLLQQALSGEEGSR